MPATPNRRELTDEEIIAGLRQRPLDKYAQAAADRLEELLSQLHSSADGGYTRH